MNINARDSGFCRFLFAQKDIDDLWTKLDHKLWQSRVCGEGLTVTDTPGWWSRLSSTFPPRESKHRKWINSHYAHCSWNKRNPRCSRPTDTCSVIFSPKVPIVCPLATRCLSNHHSIDFWISRCFLEEKSSSTHTAVDSKWTFLCPTLVYLGILDSKFWFFPGDGQDWDILCVGGNPGRPCVPMDLDDSESLQPDAPLWFEFKRREWRRQTAR